VISAQLSAISFIVMERAWDVSALEVRELLKSLDVLTTDN
jgi:hypothetical protein